VGSCFGLRRARVVGLCAREVLVGGCGKGGEVSFCPTGRIAAAFKNMDRGKEFLLFFTLLQAGLG
jgi:hypothetical protein